MASDQEEIVLSFADEYRGLGLTTDSRPDEPESLWGKMDPKSFGDRAYRGKPQELKEKIKKSKKKVITFKKMRMEAETVLSLVDEGFYQPQTKETRAAYEALLTVIQRQFGGQPQDVLTGAADADEVLAVLKNDKIKNLDKKKDIESLLNAISSQVFDQLVSIARLITDYQDVGEASGTAASAAEIGNDGGLDNDIGVAEFKEDEEESYSDQEESEDDDDGQELNVSSGIHMGGIDDDEMEETSESYYDEEQLHPTRASAKERQKKLQKSIREEARKLKDDRVVGDDSDWRFIDREVDNSWLKVQCQLLDLENLAFQQGGHLMANKKCEAPPGSYRTSHKGYEEVHVPCLKPKPFASDEKLVKISEMPDFARPAFEKMKEFNRIESKVYEIALFSHENILLCAPTGVGKTNVAMLAILHEIALDWNASKIVYVAPMKALVADVVGNLSNRLQSYNIVVRELSGDQTLTQQQIEETQIIVTTPEKWDIVTRKSGDRTYTQMVKLLIIDDIHFLHDNRGPVLESIVARTVRQIETTQNHIRFVGLSATLPNYEDLALFLRVDPLKGLFYFDNSYRPCPLSQQYIGITVWKPLQRYHLMNEICYEKVLAAAGKHQVLIFVHSSEETAKTAHAIRDTALANDTLSQFLKDEGQVARFF